MLHGYDRVSAGDACTLGNSEHPQANVRRSVRRARRLQECRRCIRRLAVVGEPPFSQLSFTFTFAQSKTKQRALPHFRHAFRQFYVCCRPHISTRPALKCFVELKLSRRPATPNSCTFLAVGSAVQKASSAGMPSLIASSTDSCRLSTMKIRLALRCMAVCSPLNPKPPNPLIMIVCSGRTAAVFFTAW